MKEVMITGGPTNEPIDEVMKITNMSTGSLSVRLGECFLGAGYSVVLILNNAVNTVDLCGENLEIVRIETTDDMLNALKERSSKGKGADAIIHASAVGDYKSDFSFLLEDMADELFAVIGDEMDYLLSFPRRFQASIRRDLQRREVMLYHLCRITRTHDPERFETYRPYWNMLFPGEQFEQMLFDPIDDWDDY